MVPSQTDMTGTGRPIRARRATPAARIVAVLTASALAVGSVPAHAEKGPPVVRDAEIEQLLKEYTQPLLRAAGLAQQNVQVVIINDRAFNAFVADGRRIFVNGGALMDAETPNQIIGVLAHETGHIAGGHLARLREAMAAATTQSIIAMLLGIGAMVAGGGNSGLGQAGAAAIAAYRYSDPRAAAASIDALIQAQPQNPYFYELKGQAMLEGGKPAEAIAPLRHAVSLAPNPTLIQIMLAQALVATRDRSHVDEAVSILRAALTREPESPDAYSQLAMAYGLKNDLPNADLASAQAAFMRGDLKTAREIATRARARFPIGSPGWVKADDLASLKPPQSALRRQ